MYTYMIKYEHTMHLSVLAQIAQRRKWSAYIPNVSVTCTSWPSETFAHALGTSHPTHDTPSTCSSSSPTLYT